MDSEKETEISQRGQIFQYQMQIVVQQHAGYKCFFIFYKYNDASVIFDCQNAPLKRLKIIR